MEHMAGSQDGLTFFVILPVGTQQITITTNDFFCLRIPYDKLLITIVTGIELIDIH